uniref:cGMP-dependent protein kinase n=1 Tax=Meloidogyne javanica TaxID=6303 RepID=A0A915N1T2_MELJA
MYTKTRGSESNILVEDEDEFEGFELSDLKTITTLGIGGFGRIEHVQNERAILMECHCDFIIRLHKTFRDSERVYMLMEYCPGGDLWTVLRSFLRLDEKKARYYCAAALEAFDYLHKRLIIYRDLKPENMLLDINGIPKLVDFGFAKRLPSEMDRAWTFCGTTEYVAPEVILGEGQDSAVDIWSYGAIIKGVQNLSWPRYISDNSRLLIFKLCRKNATQRLGYGHFDDLRKDIWFEGFDFTSFRNHSMRPPIRPKVLSLTDTRNFDRFSSTDDFACGSDDDGWDEDF